MANKQNAINFLNELSSTSDSFNLLVKLIENLEKKKDPEPLEIEIVSVGYQFLEKVELMRFALQNYVKDDTVLTGDKLTVLYEGNPKKGSSVLFD